MGPGFAPTTAAMMLFVAISTAKAATVTKTASILRHSQAPTSHLVVAAFAPSSSSSSTSCPGSATMGSVAQPSFLRYREGDVVRIRRHCPPNNPPHHPTTVRLFASRPPPPPEYSIGDNDEGGDREDNSGSSPRRKKRGPIRGGRKKNRRSGGSETVDRSSSWMDRNRRFESRPYDYGDSDVGDTADDYGYGDDDDYVGFQDDFRGTRVFVQNLPPDVTWRELKDHFRTAGEVVFASVSVNPDDGTSKGCGVVQYETVGEARRAIEIMGDHPMDGANLFVREDRQERDRRRRSDDTSGWAQRMGRGDQTTDRNEWTCADEGEANKVLSVEDRERVVAIVRGREAARRRRDYEASDSMREELKGQYGVHVDDRLKLWWTSVDGGRTVPAGLARIKGGGRWGERKTPWRQIPTTPENDACVDPNVVNELLKRRDAARMEKDFSNADALLEKARTAPEGDLYLRIHDDSRTWRIWTDDPPPRRFRKTQSEPLSVNDQCLELVRSHDPDKVDEIRKLLEKFPGREYNILKKLKQRYRQ